MAASIEDDCEDPTFNTHVAAKPARPGPRGDTVNADSEGERVKSQHTQHPPDTTNPALSGKVCNPLIKNPPGSCKIYKK